METQARTETETDAGARRTLKRRGILAAAAAVVAGIAAKQTALPIAAVGDVTGDHLIANGNGNTGVDTSAGAFQTGVYGAGSSRGVSGSGSIYGVFGSGSGTSTWGVYGNVTAPTGFGVRGYNGQRCCVVGRGTTYAVQGIADVNTTGVGVYGTSLGSTGVFGVGGGTGVEGAGTAYGVYGRSTTGPGVYGLSANSYGGIFITTSGTYAVLAGASGTGVAFGGSNTDPTGYAAYFTGNVKITGGKLFLDSQTLQSLHAHTDGSKRATYAMQAAEAVIEDMGEGTLTNGKAEVRLDPAFAGLIATDHYLVFPVSHDAGCKGLAVTSRRMDGFTVQEMNGGASSGGFAWRVVATPRDAGKAQRLAKHDLPDLHVPTVDEFPKPPNSPVPPPAGPEPDARHPAPAPNPASAPAPRTAPATTAPVAPAAAAPTTAPSAPTAPTGQPTPQPAPPARP